MSVAKNRCALALIGVLATGEVTRAETLLLMFEQPGCIYCARFDEEVAPEYPKTAEGAFAPLLRLQFAEPLPDWADLARPPAFTPTFVLVDDGREIGRIEGYPGEDFFWPLLDALIDRSGKAGG